MTQPAQERRKEPRWQATGKVEFVVNDTLGQHFEGELVDMSAGGFRAAHSRRTLQAGEEVRFRHSAGDGAARVMWSRILYDHVESGFLVL